MRNYVIVFAKGFFLIAIYSCIRESSHALFFSVFGNPLVLLSDLLWRFISRHNLHIVLSETLDANAIIYCPLVRAAQHIVALLHFGEENFRIAFSLLVSGMFVWMVDAR